MNSAPEIKIYNSLTRSKEVFKPIEDGKVSIYACGVTVYDDCHLGHALQALVFDVIVRYLEYRNFEVTYVRNYTDVDDKIIQRAKEKGVSPLELSSEMIDRERDALASLNIQEPTHTPKVSEFIPQIISFVQKLIEKDAAYLTSEGNVYYRVRSKSDYGKLSGRKVDELQSGVRKEIEGDKEDGLDFALWKSEEVEGAAWDSPFGRGRPGWHIECSVMGYEILGERFDIHGGGLDLIFPHHENEIAQSESFCGCSHVNIWMHNGLLTVNKEKMSKSLGNFYTIVDGVNKFGTDLIRFTLSQYQYRSNADFTPKMMATNSGRLAGIYEHLLKLEEKGESLKAAGEVAAAGLEGVKQNVADLVAKQCDALHAQFVKVMDDDFATPEAIVCLQEGIKFLDECLRRKKTSELDRYRSAAHVWATLKPLAGSLCLFQTPPSEYFSNLKSAFLESSGVELSWIEQRMQDRELARQEKNWEASDQIRDELAVKGVELRDGVNGSDWTVTKEGLEKHYS